MRPQTLARAFAANFLPNLSLPPLIPVKVLSIFAATWALGHNDSRDHSGAMSSAFTLSATSVGVARTKPPTGASRRGRVATVTRAACPGDDDVPVPTPVSAPGRREALLSAAALAAGSHLVGAEWDETPQSDLAQGLVYEDLRMVAAARETESQKAPLLESDTYI